MALNGDVLGLLMKAAIDGLSDSAKQDRNEVFKAMGGAIVAHIVSAGVVTLTVATATGVTAGAAAVPVVGVGIVT